MDIFPCWREACLGTIEEKIAKFADPERRDGHEGGPRRRGGGVRRRAVPARRDQGQLDLQRRAERAQS